VRWISAAFALFIIFFAVEARALACGINVVALNFGAYDTAVASPVDADGGIDVTCALNVPYLIRLDPGGHSQGGFLPRRMILSGGAYLLDYNLYRDSARTQIWGDGTNTTYVLSALGTGLKQSLLVYGRMPGSQRVAPGSYGDVITVTIEW